MFDLNFQEWIEEFRKIVDDTYGINVNEFCNSKVLSKCYGLGMSPIDAFIELDEVYNHEG